MDVTPIEQPGRYSSLYYRGLRAIGATRLGRAFQKTGPILCYHNVVGRGTDATGDRSLHISVDRFEQQMRWLAAHYRVAPLQELAEACRAGAPLRHTAAITFDDAYQGVFDHALPILRSLRLPATIFVVSDAPGAMPGFWWDDLEIAQRMTPELRRRCLTELRGDGNEILRQTGGSEIRAPRPVTHAPASWVTIASNVGKGIDLGVHSATHRSLPMLNDAELEDEIVRSRAQLHRETGVWPRLFAYPYGQSDGRTEAAVRDAGYLAGFGLDPRRFGRYAQDLWCLGRLNIPSSIADAAFEAWATGFHSRAVQ